MKFQSSKNLCALVFVIALVFVSFSCKKSQTSINQTTVEATANQPTIKAPTPTDAYKLLFEAVKAKDTGKIRQLISKNSLALAGYAAQTFKHSMEKQLENGMVETTMTDSLPEIRDERIKDNFGAIEVFNQKANRWEDTAFVFEDGGWRLAVGDQYNGTYQSPGKGQAQTESEASNSMNNMTPLTTNTNGKFPPAKNSNVKTIEVPLENANKMPDDKKKND